MRRRDSHGSLLLRADVFANTVSSKSSGVLLQRKRVVRLGVMLLLVATVLATVSWGHQSLGERRISLESEIGVHLSARHGPGLKTQSGGQKGKKGIENPDNGEKGDEVLRVSEDLESDGASKRIITHVFNVFSVPGSSPKTSSLRNEHLLVQRSWEDAAKQAWHESGIEVDFLCVVLEGDKESCPEYSRPHEISDAFVDPFNKHRLPTIGSIFGAGKNFGKGQLLIYTNADIGTTENFYIDTWHLANQDSRDPRLVRKLTLQVFEIIYYCLSFQGESPSLSSPELCQADARTYFKLHGGHRMLFDKVVARDVARLYVQNMTRSSNFQGEFTANQLKQQRAWYLSAGGQEQHSTQDLSREALDLFTVPMHPFDEHLPQEQNVFTVTRLDLVMPVTNGIRSAADLKTLLGSEKALVHPGNDCFVMPRNRVPDMILRSNHPLSWRPWGMWVPHTFEWEFGPESEQDFSNGIDNVIWRRFEGTRHKPYTFHVGVSGRIAKKWVDFFNKRPLFVLELVANWNAVTGGKYMDLFQIPAYCDDDRLFRHANFCKNRNAALRDKMTTCVGQVRYGCSDFEYTKLRDPYNYFLACERLIKRVEAKKEGQMLVEPFCSFCEKLYRIRNNPVEVVSRIKDMCAHDYKMTDCGPGYCKYVQK